MKYEIRPAYKGLFLILLMTIINTAKAQQDTTIHYYVQSEKQIAIEEAGPHKGGGNTTAHRFFKDVPGSRLQLTKRVLQPGAAIGYHLQKEEEIYYILSGTGEMTMNGKPFTVTAGDAVLTLPNNWHGLKQTGNAALVVIINYEKK